MYKLILVDDESEICEGLKEVVPFEQLGFTVVGEASNGVEALQLCEATEPDLIITDIRMPLMDGLTLCRRVRHILPAAQFIILSGYDEFEYARQAIQVKTLGYLLKPISSVEFVEMLQNVKAQLDEDFARRRNVLHLREHFRESLPLLREMLLGSLLSGGEDVELLLRNAKRYDLKLSAPCYTVALIKTGDCTQPDAIEDDQLRLFAVRNILCEVLAEHTEAASPQVFMYRGKLAVLFVMPSRKEALHASLVRLLDEARKTIEHYLACPLYVGVSAPCEELGRLPFAARQALTAVDQCVLGGKAQVLCITDIEQMGGQALPLDEFLLRQLVSSVKAGEGERAKACLSSLMDACRSAPFSPRAYQAYLMEMMVAFARISTELSLDQDGIAEDMDLMMQSFARSCPQADQAQAQLESLLFRLMGAVQKQRKTSSLRLAAEAEKYLQENYTHEDLSLEKLCLHLHISPSYFSALFKKETKKTFHQYITELRMDRALSLLGTTTMKTAQIAEQVGLPDPSYFSYCFKKHFGFPPSQARRGKEVDASTPRASAK